VISTFTSGIHSWLTRAVGTLIVEVVDIGGGTISSFTEMSNFTRKINSMEAERRSALKPYLFVIYMAAMMVVVTTFLMTFFMTQSAATGFSSVPGSSPEQTAATIDQLLVAAIFETWVIGFVAGKMGEGSTSDGFKHSLMLVLISLVSVYVASYFVSLPV
jgi:flagellar protein FlaJ